VLAAIDARVRRCSAVSLGMDDEPFPGLVRSPRGRPDSLSQEQALERHTTGLASAWGQL
jgi:hypothetical protein